MSQSDVLPITKLPLESQYARMQREFTLLQQQEDPRSINFSTSLKNKHKNRYLDILANESTIYPETSTLSSPTSSIQYINGNLIDLGLPHTFVACQAPVTQCIPDFLSMLYEKKINLVIMVTKLKEGGIVKADRYWPNGTEESPIKIPGTSGLTVSIDPDTPYEEDNTLNITKRYLILQKLNDSKHKITQIQYTGWPDHGVPQSAASFEALLNIIKQSPTNKPIVVHCSAGIGRTGTLIGTYGVLTHLERGTLHDLTVFDIVSTMKRQRFGMVQKLEQYIVIYLTLMSRLGVDVKGFMAMLNRKAAQSAVQQIRK